MSPHTASAAALCCSLEGFEGPLGLQNGPNGSCNPRVCFHVSFTHSHQDPGPHHPGPLGKEQQTIWRAEIESDILQSVNHDEFCGGDISKDLERGIYLEGPFTPWPQTSSLSVLLPLTCLKQETLAQCSD